MCHKGYWQQRTVAKWSDVPSVGVIVCRKDRVWKVISLVGIKGVNNKWISLKWITCSVDIICLVPFTHTHPFIGPFSRTTQVSRYQKGKTNLDFTEARDSEWQ